MRSACSDTRINVKGLGKLQLYQIHLRANAEVAEKSIICDMGGTIDPFFHRFSQNTTGLIKLKLSGKKLPRNRLCCSRENIEIQKILLESFELNFEESFFDLWYTIPC